MKVLILGSKGMLGGELKRTFSRSLGWDRKEIDLTQESDVEAKILEIEDQPDIIINCAAYNNVDGAEEDKQKAFEVNGEAVGKLAKIANKLNIPLVHFSTNYVFDGEKGEYAETDEPAPLSVYGQSKFEGEKLLKQNCDKYYLIRTAVLYGQPGESEFSKKSFIELMLGLSEKTDTIKAVNDEINSLTYVSDLAHAVSQLITQNYPYGIYHLTNSGQASWYDLAAEIFRLSGRNVNLLPVPSSEFPQKAKRPKKAVLLNTKFPELRSWQEALEKFLKSEFIARIP